MPSSFASSFGYYRFALEGKIVTMGVGFQVLERGTIYIDAGQIVAVLPSGVPVPDHLENYPIVRTGGTIYPGLIELHNHLSYNVLPMWQVPKKYSNRGQWGRHPDYRKLISGPMGVLGRSPGFVEAIVRYVECKCLLGGVTTSQGVALYSNSGIRKFYRGITRNAEETDEEELPEANTRISDVDASDAAKFLARLERSSCLLLHLSEGIDQVAREHFEALKLADEKWAITPALAGIHCAGLLAEDFEVLQKFGGAMIWSPLSNMLLYGETADVSAAKEAGVLIGIGSDWSPSGSKNLLGELKVAHLVSQELGGIFSLPELLAMATINAARILKWDKAIGSIEAGKRADLLVINDRRGDPYERLISSRETSITGVVINGIPRYGQSRFMRLFGEGMEQWRVGRSKRLLNLSQESADPVVGTLSLGEARQRLQQGMQRLSDLALELENQAIGLASGAATSDDEAPDDTWHLELDHDGVDGMATRPHLPFGSQGDLTGLFEEAGLFDPLAAAVPLSQLLQPVDLDELTVIDDKDYLRRLAHQINLPSYIKSGLPPLYGRKPILPDSARFIQNAHEAVRSELETTENVASFLTLSGQLTLADRRQLVEQAILLMEQIYVHLPLKRAMHAVNPIQRLKLLQYSLFQLEEDDLPPEIQFHNELSAIFTSVRDLHTNYLLPSPFKERTAYLPFLIEADYEKEEPRYIVSKRATGFNHASFVPGVEVLYWNGMPIKSAIELNADRQAGSNSDARYARGLDSLTVRPLVRMLPPLEDWVTITYRSLGGKELELKQEWLVFSPETSAGVDPDSGVAEAAVLAFDIQTDAINQTKKVLYAPSALMAERNIAAMDVIQLTAAAVAATVMPTVFRTKSVETDSGTFGYIRIFTFNVPNADNFVAEFIRLARSLPQNGLMIDVRGNGGGLVYAAERLLQVLTPRTIQPERAQFINTPLILEICRRHAPSPLDSSFDLSLWIDSIAQAVETGAVYSRGYPITSQESCNAIGQKYYGPVVLITDALCYSATDIFSAGFQDHKIGPVLGVSGNTGAGGANVWTHKLLQKLAEDIDEEESIFSDLPAGAGMRAAVRRTLRVGDRAGMPLEDLGVVPDYIHKMTRRDLLQGNVDLINRAGELLGAMPVRELAVTVLPAGDHILRFMITTSNIDRLDFYINGRPRHSFNVSDGPDEYSLDSSEILPADGSVVVEIYGFANGDHVATHRQNIS